jgi:hypothetical protein
MKLRGRADSMVQVVEDLPRSGEALSSNSTTTKERERERELKLRGYCYAANQSQCLHSTIWDKAAFLGKGSLFKAQGQKRSIRRMSELQFKIQIPEPSGSLKQKLDCGDTKRTIRFISLDFLILHIPVLRLMKEK